MSRIMNILIGIVIMSSGWRVKITWNGLEPKYSLVWRPLSLDVYVK